jgi:hypothetical protein
MEITITLRGSLRKYLGGESARAVTVPDGCTCAEALRAVGIDWESLPTFGFVAVNGMRVMISDSLAPGDELKAYSKIGGG